MDKYFLENVHLICNLLLENGNKTQIVERNNKIIHWQEKKQVNFQVSYLPIAKEMKQRI